MSVDTVALRNIIEDAGKFITRSAVSKIETKAELDFVTDIDLRVDAFLTEALGRLTPGVPVFSEERAMERPSGAFWIIDPLDGTHNMMSGIPHFAVCAALFDGTCAQIGAVFDVVGKRFYSAEKGKGAFLDDRRLQLADEPSKLIGLSSGAIDALIEVPDIYRALRKKGKLRNLGSQALHLCLVADGRFGFTVSQEARFWDDAAGKLIAEEAGAKYRAFAGNSDEALIEVAFRKEPLHSVCAHPKEFRDLENLLSILWSSQA